MIERRIYPVSLFLFSLITLLVFQVKQFKRLYERIRNDKYLVGQRLINFERNLVLKAQFANSSTSSSQQQQQQPPQQQQPAL
jgi:E3 ubiquitin-protein ligase MARCH6